MNNVPPPTEQKRRYGSMKSVGSCIKSVVRPVCQRYGFVSVNIILDWPKIVGETLANSCEVIKIVFAPNTRQNGCVHLRATSSMAATLPYYEALILEKINQYYGYKAATQLRIFHGFVPKAVTPEKKKPVLAEGDVRLVDNATSPIDYEPLRDALRGLGEQIYGKT
ncbi:MAG: DUF721 domain-containing protein [Alphaproteobacteria bacterium]|nr:DUF721 domain-containing protein [Alphaproteobacteria bacterium]